MTEQKQKTVVIAEDDDGTASLLKTILKRDGWNVVLYTTAEEALQRISEPVTDETPKADLLITDFGLAGGMNGADLIVRGRDVLSNLPVVMVTGNKYPAQEALNRQGVDLKSMEIQQKPFDLYEFKDALVSAQKKMEAVIEPASEVQSALTSRPPHPRINPAGAASFDKGA